MARNIIDFWNRWHMSLTHWVRDYVFMSSYKAVAERFPRGIAKLFGYALIFGSLVVVGLWHGVSAGYAVFGVMHGLGAAFNQAYADLLSRSRLKQGGRRSAAISRIPLIHVLAVFLTFHCVCFSFLFFNLGVSGAVELLVNAGSSTRAAIPLAWAAAVPAIGAGGAWALWALWARHMASRVMDRIAAASDKRATRRSGFCAVLLFRATALACAGRC